MQKIYKDALWVWVLFALVAVINGALRELVYAQSLGNVASQIVSTLVLVVVMLIITYVFLRRSRHILRRRHLVFIGVLWVALSVLIEFGYVHYVMGDSWDRLLVNYNILEGRVWVLVLLTELVGPLLVGSRMLSRAESPSAAVQTSEEGPVATQEPEGQHTEQ